MTNTEIVERLGYYLDRAEENVESYPADAREYIRDAKRALRQLRDATDSTNIERQAS